MQTSTLLATLTTTQYGVLTRKQAHQCGYSETDIDRWVAKGLIRTLWRGILTFNPEPDDAAGRNRELALAVSIIYGERVVVSHHSALLVAGLPTYGVDLELARLTRLNKGDSLLSPPVRISRTSASLPSYEIKGARVVTDAVAIAQVAAESGIEAAVVAGDAALRRKTVTIDELQQAAKLLGPRRSSTRAHQAIELLDARAESPGESLLRLIATRGGLALVPQFDVRTPSGTFVARVDFRVAGTPVLIEFDGRVKYQDQQALFAEKRREDAIRSLGWLVVRVVWDDLADPAALVARIREAVELHARRA
ncbi:type IV toxin-antitoxin system AbiEi family antitoxin domain-containing protein [Blastococcus sp. Marseille-P5729]|uniref:type IV toxin-antitoxin system AbiEi family antitoxin domain-containing protein n=1 Tax=Blastococcus sp. Marseille-P5729 TaxID=2086582 RepID=UPI00131BEED2|nr:type IV toxin-antitoxin system AbiEi family antitoxin domain-containing protein [Blastococcus sp. Marseille-P5729]